MKDKDEKFYEVTEAIHALLMALSPETGDNLRLVESVRLKSYIDMCSAQKGEKLILKLAEDCHENLKKAISACFKEKKDGR